VLEPIVVAKARPIHHAKVSELLIREVGQCAGHWDREFSTGSLRPCFVGQIDNSLDLQPTRRPATLVGLLGGRLGFWTVELVWIRRRTV